MFSVLGYLTSDRWVIGNCGDYEIYNYRSYPKYQEGWFLLSPYKDHKWWIILFVEKPAGV